MYTKNLYIHLIWQIPLIVLAVFPYITSILYAPVQPDAGYYLSVVERIREGLIVEKDFRVGYTPLFFYIVAFIKNVFGIGINYTFDLTLHFLFQLLTTFFIFKTSEQILNSKILPFFVAILYLLISYWICSYEFLLEIPSLMWGFFGVYLLLMNRQRNLSYFLIGIILACSFLTKQYGLGFLVLAFYLMIFQFKNRSIANYVTLLLGYVLPIIVMILLIPETSKNLFGNGYGIESGFDKFSLLLAFMNNVSISLGYLMYRLPIIIFALLLFPFVPNVKRKLAIFLILGIIGFSFQFIFAPLNHYLLYLVPFITIYIFIVFESVSKWKYLKFTYLILIVMSFVFSLKRNYNRALNTDNKLRLEQIEIKNNLLKQIKPNENIYISDYRLIYLYYLLNLHPVDMSYSFGIAIDERTHYSRIQKANNVITWENYKTLYFNELFSPRVCHYFDNHNDKYFIYKKENHLNELTNIFVQDQVVLYKND